MSRAAGLGAFLLFLLASCAGGLKDPVPIDSPGGLLDLTAWNFEAAGPVNPQGWLWDQDVLWAPPAGRPDNLPPPLALGAPDHGGSFIRTLMRPYRPGDEGKPSKATAHLRLLVDPGHSYGLQIGAVPGAFRVWVNGAEVWSSGQVSPDPAKFRPQGIGTVLTVQPRDGVLDMVVDIVSSDPLIRHSESNRLWLVGPDRLMMAAERTERTWRALQAAILALAIFTFFWLSSLRPDRKPLVYFVLFLAVCLVKLVVNVEQPEPLLGGLLPEVPLSLYLMLNHGLNLVPFFCLVLFLVRQFPEDLSRRTLLAVGWITAAVTVWELVPFVLLALGFEEAYSAVMGAQWSFLLNLYVVLGTVFIFERFYQLFQRGRPLARALFFGGIGIGVMVLLPVPLSYFIPVKYTYFLGWGMFFFLFLLGFELIRLQVRTSEDEARTLGSRLARRENLARFSSTLWAGRLGRESLDLVQPGDRRPSEAVFVATRSTLPAEIWLASAGPAASARDALLVHWSGTTAVWALDAWSETALALALELRRAVALGPNDTFTSAVLKAVVDFRVLDLGNQWLPEAAGLPLDRIDTMLEAGRRFGAGTVLESAVQDGLVIGGWRRHRHLTADGQLIELYEAEDETLAALKDKTAEAYGAALAQARAGRRDEAVKAMLPVVHQNPFDRAAREHLADWGRFRPT